MLKGDLRKTLGQERWRSDPVAFIREVLVNPETGQPFELYPAQERFLREGFTLTPEGKLPCPELVFSAPKKSGKTATAAMATIYVVRVLGGPYAEGYCLANDLEQAQGRVFAAISRIVQASLELAASAKVTSNRIEFTDTGGTITAIAADYAGAAGANPNIAVFDELWGYTSERSRRLWDELVPPPTRKVSVRLTTTYAGFEGESELLEDLYERGLKGHQAAPGLYRQPGMLMFWSHEPVAPWQTEEWLDQMRQQLRKSAYLRMIENRFTAGESEFIPIAWWDRAATGAPIVLDRSADVVLGVDAGLKRDTAAVVACTYDDSSGRVQLVNHRIFHPSVEDPLDLEGTLEATVLDYANRFHVVACLYDPWQFARSAQTLARQGVAMREYPQSVPNLTAMSMNLFELLKGGNFIAYPDDEIKMAISRAVAKESSRGLKITKEKASHKIDVVVAMAMAALGSTQQQIVRPEAWAIAL